MILSEFTNWRQFLILIFLFEMVNIKIIKLMNLPPFIQSKWFIANLELYIDLEVPLIADNKWIFVNPFRPWIFSFRVQNIFSPLGSLRLAVVRIGNQNENWEKKICSCLDMFLEKGVLKICSKFIKMAV